MVRLVGTYANLRRISLICVVAAWGAQKEQAKWESKRSPLNAPCALSAPSALKKLNMGKRINIDSHQPPVPILFPPNHLVTALLFFSVIIIQLFGEYDTDLVSPPCSYAEVHSHGWLSTQLCWTQIFRMWVEDMRLPHLKPQINWSGSSESNYISRITMSRIIKLGDQIRGNDSVKFRATVTDQHP